jgi:hypothetical protein
VSRVQRQTHTRIFGEARRVRSAIHAFRDITRAFPAKPLERRQPGGSVVTGKRTHQDQLGGKAGMPSRRVHRDRATERHSKDRRRVNLECMAQARNVIRPGVHVPARSVVAAVTAAAATMVVVHDAVRIAETIEIRTLDRMVRARPPMEHQQHRALSHLVLIGRQSGADNIEEKPNPAADINSHRRAHNARSRAHGRARLSISSLLSRSRSGSLWCSVGCGSSVWSGPGVVLPKRRCSGFEAGHAGLMSRPRLPSRTRMVPSVVCAELSVDRVGDPSFQRA